VHSRVADSSYQFIIGFDVEMPMDFSDKSHVLNHKIETKKAYFGFWKLS
jgi:hypothetical protein